MADVPDAFAHPSRVGYARNGDPFALQGDGLGGGRHMKNGHPDLAARVSLEARADLLGGEALGIFAVDGEDLVADLQPGTVGGRSLVGLGDRYPVAFLADEGAYAAVFAGGEQLEVGHLVFGDELRVGR